MGRFKHAYSLLLCLSPSHFCLFYLSFLPRSPPVCPRHSTLHSVSLFFFAFGLTTFLSLLAPPTSPLHFSPRLFVLSPSHQNRLRENYQILSFSSGADSSFKLTNTAFMHTHACTQIHISFCLRCPSAAVSRILIGWFVLSAVMWLVSSLRWESHPLIMNESQWD